MTKISAAEPVTQLKRVPIVENGEPLVDFRTECPDLTIDRPRFDYRRETLVRVSVAEKLNEAMRRIPNGYRLAIIEGWRPPHIQRRMYLAAWKRFKQGHPEWSDAQLRRVVNRFTAPLNSRVPPPHSTGGAVDVALLDDGLRLVEMMTPFEWREPKAFPLAAEGLSDEARRNRDILSSAMIGAGLTNYPTEYWHYSYGDQGWAYRGGHPHALYGPITPDGYTPDPRDVSEEPLRFLEDAFKR
jgi:D-alanyl-D-alanine dipeptidase